MLCKICLQECCDDLCKRHKDLYMYDSSIKGYRLKKRNSGSRYTQDKYHKSEIQLTKILEEYYGKDSVVTSYRPSWALSEKGALYEFDMYIKGYNTLIEYNGKQHYRYIKFFHRAKSKYKERKKLDKHKKQLAKINGFNIITFKYDEPLCDDYVIDKLERNLM